MCSYEYLSKREKGKWSSAIPIGRKETISKQNKCTYGIMKATFNREIVSTDKRFWHGTVKSGPVEIAFK